MSVISEKISKVVGGDRPLWVLIILLSLISIVVVYSSTASLAYRSNGVNTDYLINQILVAIGGLSVVFVVHLIDYSFFFKYGKYFYRFTLLLVFLTFIFGVEINGEKRWLNIPGTSLTFMPSDFLKIGLVMILSYQLSLRQAKMNQIKILPSLWPNRWVNDNDENLRILIQNSIPIIFPIAISSVAVMITNLSTAAILCGTSLIILIIGRIRWKEIGKLILCIIAVLAIVIPILYFSSGSRAQTWEKRITSYFSSDDLVSKELDDMTKAEYQKYQADVALASGWLLGKGPGNSTQRSALPHPYSDYAYAFIIEEYGIGMGIILLIFYLWIFYRSIVIFNRCEKSYPALLVLGLSLIITIQAMLHIGVSSGVFPVTGQTLPLISKGGTSIISTSIMFGIILGISRQVNELRRERELSMQRTLIEDEWGQIVIKKDELLEGDTQDVKSLFGDNIEEYQGVIWNDKENKDNS